MKTFQKPLTAAEERLCLRRCQEGDPEAKRILIERNLRLVAHVAKKYQGNGEELEDLISIGTIGLIKAISTFNSERSARLSTYAARCIDNELLMMLREEKNVHVKFLFMNRSEQTKREMRSVCWILSKVRRWIS